MSPALLSRRLAMLMDKGVLEKRPDSTGRLAYVLTDAGEKLAPILVDLAIWGKQWLPATLSRERADPDLVMWDMHRRIARERLPAARTVMRFDFRDQPQERRFRWIIADRSSVDMCIKDPGFDVDLFVETDSTTMTWLWYGDLAIDKALRDNQIELHGPRDLCSAFPGWLELSTLAAYPRNHLPRGPDGMTP